MTTKTRESAHTDLQSALGADRVCEATQADAVDGVRPEWTVFVDGTEQAAAALRIAAAHELHVVARGSGTKLDWGRPPSAVDVVIDLSQANRVVEHAAGDLVLRTQAGTTLAEIQRVVSGAGQQLSIDEPLPAATAGGVIATGTAGPSRHLYGSVRDLLIGITVVRADGTVTTSGGKVVKNVAGYDLGKLYTGSLGTLGVITEAIFRLHPLAGEHRWISVTVDDPAAAGEAADAARHSQAMPTAIEIDRGDPDGPITVCAHLEGRPEATHARALELAEQLAAASGGDGAVLDQAPDWWGGFPFDPAKGIGLRLGVEPSAVASLLAGAHEAAVRRGLPLAVRGSAGAGVINAGLPGDCDPAEAAGLITVLRSLTAAYDGYAVLWRAPRAVSAEVDPWGPIPEPLLNLMRRTKDQFDPGHRLAPGRFVGGI